MRSDHDDVVDDAVVEENWQTPHPPGALRPVPETLQLWRLPRVQNDPCTVPVRPVLLDRDSVCKDDGNEGGKGVARLLLSR